MMASRRAPFTVLTGVAAALVRANVDTDAIIPSREIKGVGKTGLADGLFAGWRYRAVGGRDPDPAFVLNDPLYAGAQILLSGENFGCGSSREHAAWALAEYGFRAILASSFNPIFFNNCVRNAIAPIVIPLERIEALAHAVRSNPQTRRVTVDLPAQQVIGPDGDAFFFAIGEEAKAMLIGALDAIDLTLRLKPEIDAFRAADATARPWVYI
jgi:3-isopropylmalate/(R)-2-methylmalate dehydratase small subunit